MNWPDIKAPPSSSTLVAETTRLGRTLHVCLQQTGDRWGDHDRLMTYGFRKLFTPDRRSNAQALNVYETNDLDLVIVGRELAVAAYTLGTSVRIASFDIGSGALRFTGFNFPKSHTINDLPLGDLVTPTTAIAAKRLAPNGDAAADIVVLHEQSNQLKFELFRIGPIGP